MSLRESKSMAWGAFLLVIILIIVAICTRVVSSIWEYSTIFLAFMAVFCHLAALLLAGMSKAAGKKLDMAALVFGVLAIIALIVVFILNFCEFY
ncbi:MAG: hypothetical protein J1F07_00265 [Muribaculaceae bacterium]|nr:hypothetical protein [Muribaculaceae bacterium]